jgi:predicted phage terminase large subunit-like protein
VITGTHYSPTDYYSFLDQNTEDLGYAKLSRNIYANGEDSSGGYLWGRFTESMELRLRAELQEQPGVFEAQYLNFVNNPALQILSTSLVQYVPHQTLIDGITDQGLVFQDPETGLQEFVIPIIAVDPAISLRSTADYTAIAVGGYTSGGKLLVNDLSVGHYSPEFTVKEVVRLVKLWKVRLVYVETVGFQRLLYDQVLKAIIAEGLRCGVLTYVPKGNKLKRIEVQLSALFNEGNVIFSERMRVSPLIMNTFDYFGRGGRDDPPDAVAVIAEKTRPRKLERITSLSTHRYPFTPTANHSFNSHFGGIY